MGDVTGGGGGVACLGWHFNVVAVVDGLAMG